MTAGRRIAVQLHLRWRSARATHEDCLYVADFDLGQDTLAGCDLAPLSAAKVGDEVDFGVPTGLTFDAGGQALALRVQVVDEADMGSGERLPLDPLSLLVGSGQVQALSVAASKLEALHAMARRDETCDRLFYARPRLVDHLDRHALGQLAALYGRLLPQGAWILDLMASCQSHLSAVRTDHVIGLGLNAEELATNPHLHARLIHDLNAHPGLPFADRSFDAVICSLSVEYLVAAPQVWQEVARVLRPGGLFVVSVSERCFPTKVTALWSWLRPFERVALLGHWFEQTGAFAELSTYSQRGWPRPADDRHRAQTALADPLYAVWARRR